MLVFAPWVQSPPSPALCSEAAPLHQVGSGNEGRRSERLGAYSLPLTQVGCDPLPKPASPLQVPVRLPPPPFRVPVLHHILVLPAPGPCTTLGWSLYTLCSAL